MFLKGILKRDCVSLVTGSAIGTNLDHGGKDLGIFEFYLLEGINGLEDYDFLGEYFLLNRIPETILFDALYILLRSTCIHWQPDYWEHLITPFLVLLQDSRRVTFADPREMNSLKVYLGHLLETSLR